MRLNLGLCYHICGIVDYKSQLNSNRLPTTGHCPPDLTFFQEQLLFLPYLVRLHHHKAMANYKCEIGLRCQFYFRIFFYVVVYEVLERLTAFAAVQEEHI